MFETSTILKKTEELLEGILLEIRILNRLIEELPEKLRQDTLSGPMEDNQEPERSPDSIPALNNSPEETEEPEGKSDSNGLDLDSILRGDIKLK